MSLAEMFFLGLLGLVIFGPKKFASIAPQVGKTIARWKKVSSEFQSQLATEISAAASDRQMGQPVEGGPVETGLVEIGSD
jgi:Sec-independent protein translocase protein TatA